VPREVKKVYIRSDLVADTNDLLGIKSQVLQQLAAELNRLGRFKVSVVDTFNESQIDSEKDTVAIVQGEVTSGGEVDRGQFTDLATCTGGIGGRLSSAGAAAISDEASGEIYQAGRHYKNLRCNKKQVIKYLKTPSNGLETKSWSAKNN
jgi:hypothetical protein